MRLLGKALTFDDVLLVPAYSQVLPRDTSLATRLSRNIALNLPLVSAAMDTVTEARLAIAIAQEGGIGIVHKNLTPKQQAAEVARVKRYESGLLRDPITVAPSASVREVVALSRQHGVSGFPVVDGKHGGGHRHQPRPALRDAAGRAPVREIMTPRERLVWVREGASPEEGKALMHQHRLERVLVVNDAFELRGLMTVKDITKQTDFPQCRARRAGQAAGGRGGGRG
jgi:IMP dehydrogenase